MLRSNAVNVQQASSMHGILLSLFPLIALIVVGYVLKRTAYLNDGFWAGAEKLNYYILFPYNY